MCMGFSAARRKDRLFSRALAELGRASPMRNRWRRRSMPSPPILRSTWILAGFLRLPNDKRHRCQYQPMHRAGCPIEAERTPYVLAGGLFAGADEGVVDLHAAIRTRAAKPQIQGAGKSRLRPASIGGGMSACIAADRRPCRAGRGARREHASDDNP